MPTDPGFDQFWGGPVPRESLRLHAPTLAFLGADPNAGTYDKEMRTWDFGEGTAGGGNFGPIASWTPTAANAPTPPPGGMTKPGQETTPPPASNPLTTQRSTPAAPPPSSAPLNTRQLILTLPPGTQPKPTTGAGGVPAPAGAVPGNPFTPAGPTTPPPGPPRPTVTPNTPTTPYGGEQPPPAQTWQQLFESLFGGDQEDNESRMFSRNGLDPRLDALFQYGLGQALQRFMDPNGQNFFDGQSQVADLTPDELRAQAMLRALATGGMSDLSGNAANYASTILGREPGNNPDLDKLIDATLRDVTRQTTDPGGVFSQIRNATLQNGSFGGTRQGVMEGVAAGRLADSLAKTSSEMRLAGREQDLRSAQSILQTLPTITNTMALPAGLMSAVGGQNRAQQQAVIDSLIRAWSYNNFEPDRRLENFFRLVGSAPLGQWGAGSSWLSPDQSAALRAGMPGDTSSWQNILGLIAGGAGLWNIFNPR